MKVKLLPALFVVAVLLLSACSAGATATPVTAEFPSGEGCDQGPAGTIPLINQDHGYCLRYTEGFKESYPTASETVVEGPVPASGTQPRLFIEVSKADGRIARQIADGLVADAKSINPNIGQTDLTFAGEPAILLEGMPGQDLSRQIIVVRGDRAYHLTFVSWDENEAAFSQVETLYNTVLSSFEFH